MDDHYEKLGQLIDKVDNLALALNIPMPAALHVEGLRGSLPEIVKGLKDVYVEITNENPWE